MTSHTFNVDKLNIGGSLTTLLHSYITETPLIIDEPRTPVEFAELDAELDFTFLGYRPNEKIQSSMLWDRLSFLLSLGGFIMFPNSVETMRYEENVLKVVTHDMRRVEVRYNKLNRFDNKFTGFTWIYDWFAVRSGGQHNVDILTDDDDYLVNKLIFFPSKRRGVRNKKDVVSVSLAKTQDIYGMEYSEGYVGLKTRNMMDEAGILGTSKGYGTKGFRRYDPIKIEHLYRQYEEQLIPDMTIGQVLSLPHKQGVLCKLTRNLFKARTPFT